MTVCGQDLNYLVFNVLNFLFVNYVVPFFENQLNPPRRWWTWILPQWMSFQGVKYIANKFSSLLDELPSPVYLIFAGGVPSRPIYKEESHRVITLDIYLFKTSFCTSTIHLAVRLSSACNLTSVDISDTIMLFPE